MNLDAIEQQALADTAEHFDLPIGEDDETLRSSWFFAFRRFHLAVRQFGITIADASPFRR